MKLSRRPNPTPGKPFGGYTNTRWWQQRSRNEYTAIDNAMLRNTSGDVYTILEAAWTLWRAARQPPGHDTSAADGESFTPYDPWLHIPATAITRHHNRRRLRTARSIHVAVAVACTNIDRLVHLDPWTRSHIETAGHLRARFVVLASEARTVTRTTLRLIDEHAAGAIEAGLVARYLANGTPFNNHDDGPVLLKTVIDSFVADIAAIWNDT